MTIFLKMQNGFTAIFKLDFHICVKEVRQMLFPLLFVHKIIEVQGNYVTP